jgi:hypothetical protein
MSEPNVVGFEPTQFSLFAIERLSHAPITRLPVYAEVVWSAISPPPQLPPPDQRFEVAIGRALSLEDGTCSASGDCTGVVVSATQTALPITLSQVVRDQLAGRMRQSDIKRQVDFFRDVIKRVLEAASVTTLGGLASEGLGALLPEAVRAAAVSREMPVNERPADPGETHGVYPLGLLATDHVGYLAFDLKPLPTEIAQAISSTVKELRTGLSAGTKTSIWVYPFGAAGQRFDALQQFRFTSDAIVMRLALDGPRVPHHVANLGLLAMQDPGLTDWRLSPGSFAANPGTLIGQDGCESILPANISLHEFLFHKIIRLSDVSAAPDVLVNNSKIGLGLCHDYRLRWYALGHSLGQILYSCPLAPGESVNLAVVDWTRRDRTQRDEATRLNEQLVHDQRRDRTISETVNAALTEIQRGSSFMGGLSGAAGAGLGVISGGASFSLGGATSKSSGSRELAGSTVQQINDHISQASSAVRELHSTVVIESSQAEKEVVETRTIVNYNHSHALTILYYEVQRHFRIVADLAEERPVILVGMPAVDFSNDDKLIEKKYLLEQALLDERLRTCFEAVDKLICLKAAAKAQAKQSGRNVAFTIFSVEMLTGRYHEDGSSLRFSLVLKDGGLVRLLRANVNDPDSAVHKGNPFTAGQGEYAQSTLMPEAGPVAFSSIKALRINFVGHDKLIPDRGYPDPADWTLGALRLRGTHAKGDQVLFDSLLNRGFVCPPGAGPGSAAPVDVDLDILSPEPLLFDDPTAAISHLDLPDSDRCCFERLQTHLISHSAHYNRFIKLNEDPDERAARFDGISASGGRTLLDLIENRALATFGDAVAFPIADEDMISRINNARGTEKPSLSREKLITLPTRGVFAEAKLGHCNASEEIDNTRFWDWQQSPIPHLAPEIAPVQTVVPQVVFPDGMDPSKMPTSLVHIVNPPAAPDPHGLSAALTAISAANIFRDMSGRSEVEDLLKKLTEASVSIASVAQRAAPTQTPPTSGGPPARGAPAMPPSQVPSTPPAQTPEQRESAHIDNIRKAGQTAMDYLPPNKRGPVQDKIAFDLRTINEWRFVVKGMWVGQGFLRAPMEASYGGNASFADLTDDTIPFVPTRTDERAIFHARHQGSPVSVTIEVKDFISPGGSFGIDVPAIAVDNKLTLKAARYKIPLRGDLQNISAILKDTVLIQKADPKNPVLSFEVTGKIGRKEIKVTSKIKGEGELSSDFERALEREATVEILKLAINSTLKSAIKVMIGTEVGIEGTYEIIFFDGLELKQVGIA